MEATVVIELYTDNNDFYNGKELEKDPLYVIHGHLIYMFRPGVWESGSVGNDYGGESTVDGTKKDDQNQNIAWALSFGLPVSRHLGVKLVYIGTRTQESTGIDSDTFALEFSGFW